MAREDPSTTPVRRPRENVLRPIVTEAREKEVNSQGENLRGLAKM